MGATILKKSITFNLTGTALCVALGLVLPLLFHALGAGPIFLPMHIPVLLCGLLFGWQFGAVCGLAVPILSSVFTSMPPIFPTAVAMMFELCTYGVLTGVFHRKLHWNIYSALIFAMLGGRLVSGIANAVLMGVSGKPYGIQAFVTSAFVESLPGIILQIVLVPFLVLALEKTKIFRKENA